MVKRTITLCLAAAALGIGACGGSDEPAASTAPESPAASGTTVSVGDNTFTPADLEVAVGETVTFENSGAIAHTATASEGADFDSGSIAPGEKFTFTPSKAGTVSYVCTFHPGMQGTIQVN
jgi:plastocyanin